MAIPIVQAEKINHQKAIPTVTFSRCTHSTNPIARDNEPKIFDPYQNLRYCTPLIRLKPNPTITYTINKNARPFDISKVKRITKTESALSRIVTRLTKWGSFAIPNHITNNEINICPITGSRRGIL